MRVGIRIAFLIRYEDIVAANASGQLWLILDSMVLDVKVGLGSWSAVNQTPILTVMKHLLPSLKVKAVSLLPPLPD